MVKGQNFIAYGVVRNFLYFSEYRLGYRLPAVFSTVTELEVTVLYLW